MSSVRCRNRRHNRSGYSALAVELLEPRAMLSNLPLTQYVNPFIGTDPVAGAPGGYDFDAGDVFPGATTPQGMAAFSPDTTSLSQPGAYLYTDTQFRSFSIDHFSGRGVPVMTDFGFMPVNGGMAASSNFSFGNYLASFLHSNETATPGYYKVLLSSTTGDQTGGQTVELTDTPRTGMMQVTFPSGVTTGTILLNVANSVQGNPTDKVTIIGSNQTIDGLNGSSLTGFELTGYCESYNSGPTPYYLYFSAIFFQPVTASGTWTSATLTPGATTASGSGGDDSGNAGAYVSFNTSTSNVVDLAIGISYVSIANAQENLATETPTASTSQAIFAAEAAAASTLWNNRLNIIQIPSGGNNVNDLTAFYTALYHTMIEESILDDVNGQYPGWDCGFTASGADTVETVATGHHHYSEISGWDLYRSESPLMALLLPSVDADIVQSMIDDATQGNQTIGRWIQENSDSLGMIGDGGSAIVDNAFAFGAAANSSLISEEAEIATYLQNNANGDGGVRTDAAQYNASGGYVPDSASTTLEYAITDMADAAYFQSIGDTSLYESYLVLAQNWENNFDPNNLSINSRSASGAWDSTGTGWTEGTQPQYTWMVPFNQAALINMMGGNANAVSRLNTLFTQLNAGPGSNYYFAGNEPDESQPWSYDYAGAPWLTQYTIRQIQTTLYTNTVNWPEDGIPGNDDGGAMSSWYVFSALGLYPMVSGEGGFVIGSPLFTSATVNLQNGQVLQINGNNAGDADPYVQSMQINGQANNSLWLPVSTILNNPTTTLTFNLGSTANTSWGSSAADAPPSFDVSTPTIAAPASANQLNGTTFALSTLGADTGPNGEADGLTGEAGLTYTWSVTSAPSGASAPAFSINGTNAAKNDVVTLTQAGNYTLQVTIVNSIHSVTSSVNVTVIPTLTTLVLTPAKATVAEGGTEQFAAEGLDQFGNVISPPPVANWSVVAGGAGGSVSTSGLYAAPETSGTDTVSATTGSLSATATVNVVPAETGVLTLNTDIGSPLKAGSTAYNASSDTYTLQGGGADIAGYSDSFQFAYAPLSADGSITAEALSVQDTSALAKAGVMFRDSSLAANAPMALLAVTPDNKLMFVTRTTFGGLASVQVAPGFSPWIWLELTRTGSSFAAFYSVSSNPIAQDWFPVGSAVTISALSTVADVGLAVTAQSKSALNTSTFSGVSVTTASGGDQLDFANPFAAAAWSKPTVIASSPPAVIASSPPAGTTSSTPVLSKPPVATTTILPAIVFGSRGELWGPPAPVKKTPTAPAASAKGSTTTVATSGFAAVDAALQEVTWWLATKSSSGRSA